MKAPIIYAGRFEEPEVFEFPIEDFGGVDSFGYRDLDLIFMQCNHVDGNEWIAGKKLRSMSVCDMILVEIDVESKILYVCCGCGWKEINQLVKTPEPWPKVN
jgi:hypothetical protein